VEWLVCFLPCTIRRNALDLVEIARRGFGEKCRLVAIEVLFCRRILLGRFGLRVLDVPWSGGRGTGDGTGGVVRALADLLALPTRSADVLCSGSGITTGDDPAKHQQQDDGRSIHDLSSSHGFSICFSVPVFDAAYNRAEGDGISKRAALEAALSGNGARPEKRRDHKERIEQKEKTARGRLSFLELVQDF
jgi:hypothetical protein